jgi:hypothetical protein
MTGDYASGQADQLKLARIEFSIFRFGRAFTKKYHPETH